MATNKPLEDLYWSTVSDKETMSSFVEKVEEIVAVESEQYIADVYKQLYPGDTIIVGDAHQYLLDHYKEFDFIWSSPPCPTHSRMVTAKQGHGIYEYPDMSLYQEIIFLSKFFKGNWIVENVTPYYKPLIQHTAIIDRHYVWSNMLIYDKSFTRKYTGAITDQTKETLAASYGIDLPEGTKNQRKLLRNAVLPEMGLYIMRQVKEKTDAR
jgi:DNA (cytosine-5)-methyltransferase 1